jgi:mRNA interferase MazF
MILDGVRVSDIIVRRSDIYMATLLGNKEGLLSGIHPVLIISSKKYNSSTMLVNVIPITSTLKSNVNNVPVGKESGLLHDSVLLCGMVLTISQKDLGKKVGFINPQKMDLVIRTIIKQFSGKNTELSIVQKEKLDYMLKSIKELIDFKTRYNITDTELDLKIDASIQEIKAYCNSLNYKYTNWGNLEMFKVYEEKRNEARLAKCQNNYKLMAQLCKEYLENLYEMDYTLYGKDIYSEFEWSYYNLALATKKLGNIKEAYDLAKQALNFTNGDKDNYYAYSCWLVGSCCMELSDDFKAEGIKMFEECISFYKKIKYVKYEILSIFNCSKIKSDISSMKECIVRYEKENLKNILFSIGDMQDDEVLMQLKSELKSMNSII